MIRHLKTGFSLCHFSTSNPSGRRIRGSQIAMDALDFGAVDIVTKPEADVKRALEGMINDLIIKVKMAAKVDVSDWKGRKLHEANVHPIASKALSVTTDKVIAIGASTGGTTALKDLLVRMPAGSPGMVIVQHMPPKFTGMFASRLNNECALTIKEAENGDQVSPGKVLIAPGGEKHMSIKRVGGFYKVFLKEGERVNGHVPSVDVLFDSVAQHAGRNMSNLVLIVDDEHTTQLIIKEILTSEGYSPIICSDGLAAVEMLQVLEFQLVILDLNLPGIDGWKVLDYIKAEVHHTSVMLLTGSRDTRTLEYEDVR